MNEEMKGVPLGLKIGILIVVPILFLLFIAARTVRFAFRASVLLLMVAAFPLAVVSMILVFFVMNSIGCFVFLLEEVLCLWEYSITGKQFSARELWNSEPVMKISFADVWNVLAMYASSVKLGFRYIFKERGYDA